MPKEARERQTIMVEVGSNSGRYITQTLPEICMDVHMYQSGSGPDLGEERYKYHLETLQIALDNWKEERLNDKLFDDAVKNLIIATLKESRGERYV